LVEQNAAAALVLIADLDRTPGPNPFLEAKVAAGATDCQGFCFHG
jgi:hypothetical protein